MNMRLKRAKAQNDSKTSPALKDLVQKHGADLSAQLQAHRRSIFPPEAEKTIRPFTPSETAKLLGIHESYLRQIAAEGTGCPTQKTGRRSYTVQAISDSEVARRYHVTGRQHPMTG
jgi:chromosome partitioning protein